LSRVTDIHKGMRAALQRASCQHYCTNRETVSRSDAA
jgi:hypothetical protein